MMMMIMIMDQGINLINQRHKYILKKKNKKLGKEKEK